MWPILAMTALKMVQDSKNQNAATDSAAITQKYSPWTGQQADWSGAMKNNGMSTLISGAGSAMLQNKMDGLAAKEAQNAANLDDADYYSKLSADPSSVGVSPIAGKSAFAAAAGASPVASNASRAPAVLPGGNQQEAGPSFQDLMKPQYNDPTPLMLQGHVPQKQQNPWLMMAGAR